VEALGRRRYVTVAHLRTDVAFQIKLKVKAMGGFGDRLMRKKESPGMPSRRWKEISCGEAPSPSAIDAEQGKAK
jgi:hypothetical protein